VKQAELDLERTTIRAPFDAHVLSRNVNIGSQVAPGDQLSRLIGMDEYWVVLTVPMSRLRWLSFPDTDQEGKGSTVRLRNRTAWMEGQYRIGHLYRQIGALEEQTRLARVLVTVPDPLGVKTDTVVKPRLIVGSFLETHIEANPIHEVIRLERDYLRQNETVWVMEEGKLSIRKVKILVEDAVYAYITEGINDGEMVVTTNLSTVTNGAPLRIEEDSLRR
jgi:multidrug efflux pump subunit AcrA (membrane-fusion protein)